MVVLDEILRVGAGKPSGVPRPVVNRRSVAPLATRAVDDTPSLPGASTNHRPPPPSHGAPGSPHRSTPFTGARPPSWIPPSDFSSTAAGPPAPLPGDELPVSAV